MFIKVIIIILMLIILASLGSAMIFLVKDNGQSKRTIKALTWRIALSIVLFLLVLATGYLHADTIGNFIKIANGIPAMEMKADPQSQAWARSARNILNLTSENVAESLTLANKNAAIAGSPLFCPPNNAQITSSDMSLLIQKTYNELANAEQDKSQMSVSQVALLGLSKQYPCESNNLRRLPKIIRKR